MENVYLKIGKLLKEWRQSHGYSLYKIAKDGPGNVRYDSLGRIEKGKIVSSETLLCYVDFCYKHGFRIFDEIYNNIMLQQQNVVENEDSSKAKEQTVDEVSTTSEEEEIVQNEEDSTEPEDTEYAHAVIDFNNKQPMDEVDQTAFIRHHRCPVCGNALRKRTGRYGPFIGCTMFDNKEDQCTYSATGTFENFTLKKNIVHPK